MSALDDYRKLLVTYPKGQYTINTLEIQHSLLSRTYYLTNDTADVTADDENGVSKTYESTQIQLTLNQTSDDLDQNFKFTFADLENVWDDELQRIPYDNTEPMLIIYRSYVSTNLLEPSLRYKLFVMGVNQSNGSITLECGVQQLNWFQTGVIYDFDTFPMLRGVI